VAINHRLDRRHDISKGERLPERFSRVLDDAAYREGVEVVLNNENDAEAARRRQEAKETAAAELACREARIRVGDPVILLWNGAHIVRAEGVRPGAVLIGTCWHGMELVRIPSMHLMAMLRTEIPEGEI
jgi:hypothetical protein